MQSSDPTFSTWKNYKTYNTQHFTIWNVTEKPCNIPHLNKWTRGGALAALPLPLLLLPLTLLPLPDLLVPAARALSILSSRMSTRRPEDRARIVWPCSSLSDGATTTGRRAEQHETLIEAARLLPTHHGRARP